jgi:hypothetical protein
MKSAVYAPPRARLADIFEARPLVPDERGHTSLDNFEHFCAYSGCDSRNAWAKLAFVSARLAKTCA